MDAFSDFLSDFFMQVHLNKDNLNPRYVAEVQMLADEGTSVIGIRNGHLRRTIIPIMNAMVAFNVNEALDRYDEAAIELAKCKHDAIRTDLQGKLMIERLEFLTHGNRRQAPSHENSS